MFYYLWDVPIFMAMGAIGGVMGAGFCHLNVKVTQFRHKCVTSYVRSWAPYCSSFTASTCSYVIDSAVLT